MDPDLRRDDSMDPDLRRDDSMDPYLRRDDTRIPTCGWTGLLFSHPPHYASYLIQLISSPRQKCEQSSSQHHRLQVAHRCDLLSRDSLDHGRRIYFFFIHDLRDRLLAEFCVYALSREVLADSAR